jgi:cell division protein ZipA
MNELRWILLGLGVVIIAGVVAYTRLQDWRRDGPPWRRRERPQREPFAGYQEPALDAGDPLADDPLPTRDPNGDAAAARGENEGEGVVGPARVLTASDEFEDVRGRAVGEERIIALSVMAPEGQPYNGAAIAEVLAPAGLGLTGQGVFECPLSVEGEPVALYTVASIVEPGTFDTADPAATTTPGVVFIMQVPAPFDGLAVFERMLASARRLAQALGGQLLDGRRCDLTPQAIEHWREALLEYRRRARVAERRPGGGA